MITINETNFPDKKFHSWLLKQDYGKDGVLTEKAIKGVTEINVRDQDISSLDGIEHFTALKKLNCFSNKLTSLNVSGCTALTELDCNDNQLTSLNVSGCTALTILDCSYNELTTIDVSGCTALAGLDCSGNRLTNLDVSGCTALKDLFCSDNGLTTLDVSGCMALTKLNCEINKLTNLDVSRCTALTGLYCYCNQLKGAAMDRLIESLPQTEKESGLYVYDGKEEREKNVCTKAQVTAARAKGWRVFAFNDKEGQPREEYEGCDE